MKSVELEQALLGCLITDSFYIDSVKQYIPGDEFFYSSFNKKVWKALDKLHSKDSNIDLITICEEVGNNVDGYNSKYEITGFLDSVTSPSNAVEYAKRLHSYYLRRILYVQVNDISKGINDPSLDTNNLLEDAHTTIGNIIKLQPNQTFDIDSLLKDTKDSILNSTTQIATGIGTLDRVITGMTRGEITIIAGRPGNAKTTVSANIARNLVHKGMKVAMFNREMPNTEMMKKFIAMESKHLQYRNLRNNVGIDQLELSDVSSLISDTYSDKLFMFDDVRDIEGTFREIKAINPDVVIDDHIGLIEHPANDRRDLRLKIGDVSRSYKWLAKAQDMSVILVSQMNRNMEHRNDRIPRLSDLAESGNLEQDAEIVVFSHYPWVSRYGDDGNSDCFLELIVAKNRYGSTNSCEVGYHGNSCLVTNTEAEAVSMAKERGENVSGTPKPF
jgi:replicative DNA helicase|tara:strand:- start:418 stop:1749 length:1332 start_codon:yes stop_codon:yes gene_type:complete